ncbi:hypothetical protein HZY97_20220 [Sphingomonas sp. R-74633]|uniref:hypothetical protein n=1 Tax=Sphingomonas sp. R-74633 TaxID=2751188 RepID=UPI0015D3B95D|nr:hypothetical protein [Sphingomonas sp. R-74633]NYT43112.1 hypothetical protein [Sphingomonas sp. R-74633]
MKNALVLHDHFGDDGMATEGKILRGITTKRFEALEKQGLVREATADDLEAGDQHAFEKDTSEEDGDEIRLHLSIDSAAVQEIVTKAKEEIDRIEGLRVAESQRADAAEKALEKLTAELGETKKDLDAAKAESEQLRGELKAALAKGEKQRPAAANKKAADPANKGA